jgi:NAD(P)-dependent dehydrogenase (short-subunit alcohol dehydrogenase family)
VLDEPSLDAARDRVLDSLGRVDILLNIAGGNLPGATLSPGAGAFELAPDALRAVVDLNLMGTVLPIKAFGPLMVAGEALAGGASIVNVASVSAMRPLSRVPGYSAAKAAVASFTQWLAVELGRQYRGRIRVNALVPGFFVATQNRSLLTEDDGAPTPRGHRVLEGTPLGRFGAPGELAGAAVWLCGPSAAFVTGSMIVVDGGFSAASGV